MRTKQQTPANSSAQRRKGKADAQAEPIVPEKSGLRNITIALLLIALTLLAFWPALLCGFVSLDDPYYVRDNTFVQQGLTAATIHEAFTGGVLGLYSPLSMLSLALDREIFGMTPWGFHLSSILIHAGGVAVLFLVLRQMTGSLWRSALAAALFAVHPLRVESVAWIAERKDVLALLFGLLALWAYMRYARKPNWRWYIGMLVFFVLSLMAKPMFVTFPFLFSLLDYWPLGRFKSTPPNSTPVKNAPAFTRRPVWKLLLEKLPMLLIACAAIFKLAGGDVGAMLAEPSLAGGATAGYQPVVAPPSFAARLENVPIAYVRYVWKMVSVGDLAVRYPLPPQWPMGQIAGAVVLLLAITALCLWQVRKRPWLVVGWFWFLGTLVPVIGLVQSWGFALADRYSYFPSIGLLIMLAWSIPANWVGNRNGKIAAASACGLALTVLTAFTWVQISYWKDSVTLFDHAVQVSDKTDFSYTALARGLLTERNPPDALRAAAALRTAIDFRPDDPRIRMVLVRALDMLRQFGDGERELQAAIATIPESMPASTATTPEQDAAAVHWGVKPKTMRAEFLLDARVAQAHDHYNYGLALEKQADQNNGNHAAAIAQYQEAVRLQPDYANTYYNMANCLLADQNFPDAITQYRAAITLNPQRAEWHFNLAVALEAAHRHAEAMEEARQVQQLNPQLYNQLPPTLKPGTP